MAIDQLQLETLTEAGQRYYEDHLKERLEPLENGRFVAIDPRSGVYCVGDTPVLAFDGVRSQGCSALLYLGRVGYASAGEMW